MDRSAGGIKIVNMNKVMSREFNLFINGELISADGGKTFDSINPSDGQVFAQVADASKQDVVKAVAAARETFDSGIWSGLSVKERGVYLVKVSGLIRKYAKELADLESRDTGKTGKQTTFIDIPTCADTFEYFGKLEDPFKSEVNPVTAPVKSTTEREPIGVVACIIPWNYPLIMTGWKVAPALIAGNTVVFKTSRQASVSVMRLAEIFKEAGLPGGVVNFVATTSREASDELLNSPNVDMISFTGGTSTGEKIMGQAAATTKKVGLELGGKSPNIVFADCDMEAAVGGTMSAIFMNQGQMCTAGARLLLDEKIYDVFLEKLVEKTKSLKIGPAQDYATDFGPLVSKEHRDEVLLYIEKGQQEGATLLCGGNIPDVETNDHASLGNGFYLEPTIFGDVTNDMAIAQEEIFGPVLSVIKFSTQEEAVRIANDTPYGLASCVWTKDLDKANAVAKQLRCGTVWINTYGGFYNEAPSGGYKRSGFGRELGRDGLLEYTQTKHVCIDQTPGGRPLVAGWF